MKQNQISIIKKKRKEEKMKKDSYTVMMMFPSLDVKCMAKMNYNVRLMHVCHKEDNTPTYVYEVIDKRTREKKWEESYTHRINADEAVCLAKIAFEESNPLLYKIFNNSCEKSCHVLVDSDENEQKRREWEERTIWKEPVWSKKICKK